MQICGPADLRNGVGYKRLTSLITAHILPRPTFAAAIVMQILDFN